MWCNICAQVSSISSFLPGTDSRPGFFYSFPEENGGRYQRTPEKVAGIEAPDFFSLCISDYFFSDSIPEIKKPPRREAFVLN
jgi:hypothetical protein